MMSLLDKGEVSSALVFSTSTFNQKYICSTNSLGNILNSLNFSLSISYFFQEVSYTQHGSSQAQPKFHQHYFFAANTCKNLLTNSLKQRIFSSSIPFGLNLDRGSTNRFRGDFPSIVGESLKITRHASFSIAIVSHIELGQSTTTPGDHSLGF